MFPLLSRANPEPARWDAFVCLSIVQRLQRGSRARELRALVEEAAEAWRDHRILEGMA
jgi:hypothetical protein